MYHSPSSYNPNVRNVKRRSSTLNTWGLVLFAIAIFVFLFGGASPDAELLFVLAIAPSAFLIWFFHHSDKYKHESHRLMTVTFILGAVSIIPAIFLESILRRIIPNGPDILTTFLFFLIGVGLVEESLKFLSVRIYAYRSPLFDEPMDGIVLGVTAALGFATIENIGYVFQFGIATAILRGLLSVPGHAFWGAIMGFYLGEAKVRKNSSIALRGLVIAIFLHGLFDTIGSAVPNGLVSLILLAAFILLIYFKVVKTEITEAEKESPYRPGGAAFR
ncbi:MAG: PrsW family intramembrane metalloprotease [Thaumarchaeota archaeon]|nr:PrsW family intramembrane metalloprotease [Nitrososphaerota archaeon]